MAPDVIRQCTLAVLLWFFFFERPFLLGDFSSSSSEPSSLSLPPSSWASLRLDRRPSRTSSRANSTAFCPQPLRPEAPGALNA